MGREGGKVIFCIKKKSVIDGWILIGWDSRSHEDFPPMKMKKKNDKNEKFQGKEPRPISPLFEK